MICPLYLEHRTGFEGLKMTGSNGVSGNRMGQNRSEDYAFAAIRRAGAGRSGNGRVSIETACGRDALLPSNNFRDNEGGLYELKSDG